MVRYSGFIKRKKKIIEEECYIMVCYNLKFLRVGGRDLVFYCRVVVVLFFFFVCGS